MIKAIVINFLLGSLLFSSVPVTAPQNTTAQGIEVDATSAILMEAKTKTVLYEKNAEEALPPASVTKVMTLLLVAEAIENGRIALTDNVTVSENAASMGGSQVFLEEGERMSVEELLKCTVIASANDAAVALAEHVAGSEGAFVSRMNERARELSLASTSFENTTGLDDTVTNHKTSAKDIAIMSSELLRHECILKYSRLWQDTIRDGAFTLTNTNRLVRYYEGCTGLKTGSTDKAGYCVSATAKRGNMELICVVMGAETRDDRNKIARELLDFGFSSYALYETGERMLEYVPVLRGTVNETPVYSESFSLVIEKGMEKKIEMLYEIPKELSAPLTEGETVGCVKYMLDGVEIGKSNITVKESIEQITISEIFLKMLTHIVVGANKN